MYLFIFDDGSLGVSNTISEIARESCEDGLFDIVRTRIEGTEIFYDQYLNGEWHQVVEAE